MAFKQTKFGRYVWNLLIAIDQFFNTLFGGDPDETISSRLGKVVSRRPDDCKFCVIICKGLNWFDANHCIRVIEEDRGSRDVIK